jgi:hypothetical protein
MTTGELRAKLNRDGYPAVLDVDAETFVNVFTSIAFWANGRGQLSIAIGPNGGLMFKAVELLPPGQAQP